MSEAPDPKPAPQAKPLKATLNLPQTAFPMKANLPVNEPLRLQQWQDDDLYGQIRRARAGAPRYILHDGPPYANGAIHLGHALNKGLKDFIVKSKTMAGFDAPYIPGCDCHGLPIEIKVEEQLGRKRLELPETAIMEACRAYAQKYVDLQISQFVRLGIFGRWDKPYKTMTRDYEARTLEAFYGFLEKGFVYRGLKPVYWCIHDRTTLAEAEVEYEQHTSPSVYVRYKLNIDSTLSNATGFAATQLLARAGLRDIYSIIWTTTPWTLPASLAIAFHPRMEYVAIDCVGGIYIVAKDLLPSVIIQCHLMSAKHPDKTASESDILDTITGVHLARLMFQHPFLDREVKCVLGDYVTADQGTGAVHTAPAHGVDDFASGQRYGLDIVQYVDDAGRQVDTKYLTGSPGLSGQHSNDGRRVAQTIVKMGEEMPYEGLTVFKSNPVIVELLKEKGALLAISNLEHSYPHCWRCHNPVITRATEQWFIGMDTPMPAPSSSEGVILSEAQNLSRSSEAPQAPAPITTLRQLAIEEIDKVVWDPAWGKVRITNMIATRPDWCISRQKIWDVPIAVFLCEKCNRPIVSPELNRAVVALIEREGIEAWRTPAADALLPAGSVCAHCGGTAFRKETDILDVWIDAGVSWFAVCEADPELKTAYTAFQAGEDVPVLYLEGADQYRGWFHSSLLTSVALRGHAPYSRVVTNGWTLDEKGRALSKSHGNFIDPVAIMDQLGGDIVRLWVASVDFREDVVASLPLLKRLAEEIYRKLRNTFRFLLGALTDTNPTIDAAFHDFNPKTDSVPFEQMQPIDQYILTRAAELTKKVCGYQPNPEFVEIGDIREEMDPPKDSTGYYAEFQFHRVYHALNEFCNSELSAFYLDVLKDRLYTYPIKFKPGNNEQQALYTARRSAQTAIYKITDALARLTAPILSFTADEVWENLPGTRDGVHLQLFPKPEELASLSQTSQLVADWENLINARWTVFGELERKRSSKIIGKSLEANVTLRTYGELFNFLQSQSQHLTELFGVSSVIVVNDERLSQIYSNNASTDSNSDLPPIPEESVWPDVAEAEEINRHDIILGCKLDVDVSRATAPKCDRCWRHVPDVGQQEKYPTVCLRCAEALDAIDFPPYAAANV